MMKIQEKNRTNLTPKKEETMKDCLIKMLKLQGYESFEDFQKECESNQNKRRGIKNK